jgi:hypothetical protein
LLSFKEHISIGDLFEVRKQDRVLPKALYTPVSLICFVGQHYLTFIKNELNKWTLYNDCKLQENFSWSDVVYYALDTKSIPTVVIFEMVN